MRRLNLVSFVFGLIALFTLGACGGTGGGYNIRPWLQNTEQQAAQQQPKTLSDTYKEPQIADAETPPGAESEQITAEPYMPQPNLPPVKVGLLLPLSGPNASLGASMLKASQIALFDVGYEGFELLPRDTKGTPEGAREAARAAIQEGARIILGPVFAEEVSAIRSITNEARVNVIAYSTDWTLAGGNTYIMGFLPFDQIERVTQYAAAHNAAHIGVIAPQTDYGRAVVSAYQTVAPRTGAITADIVTFPAGNNQLEPILRGFAKYGERTGAPENVELSQPFDAVLMPVGGETALSIATLLSSYDLPPQKVRRLGTGLFDDPALATENSLAGAWFAAPSPRLRQSFEQRFQSTYNYPAPRLATLAYDSTALAAVLAKRGLSMNGRPAFDQQSITNPNGFAGIDGIFRFRADGTVERGLAILEFRGGQIAIIDEAPKTFQRPITQ